MQPLVKGMIVESIASTEAKDVQGEVLDLKGADISALLEGRGFVNSDHSNKFEHLIGRVMEAKKIHALADCETPKQVQYWTDHQKPFLWSKMELWDGHGHNEADAVASIYRHYMEKGEEPPIKVSVEGKTLERDDNGLLKRTVIKGLALTVHPANRATRSHVVGMVKSAGAPDSLVKSEGTPCPLFIEMPGSSIERLYSLAMTARDLTKKATEASKVETKISKSAEALKRFRALKQLA